MNNAGRRGNGSDSPDRPETGLQKSLRSGPRAKGWHWVIAIFLVVAASAAAGVGAVLRRSPGDDSTPAAGGPAADRLGSAPRGTRRKGWHRAVAILLVVAAGAAGAAGTALSQIRPQDDAQAMRKCTAPVRVAEQLTIRTDKQPVSLGLKAKVTVKLGTAEAHDLLAAATSGDYNFASSCYFQNFSQVPLTFLSAGNGVATFSDQTSDQDAAAGLLSPGDGWTGSLQDRALALQFSPVTACLYGWAGTQLALTVDTDTPPGSLSPTPDRHAGSSYTWSTPLKCDDSPGVLVSVPLSWPAYLATSLNNGPVLDGFLNSLAGWSGEIILFLFAIFFCARNRHAHAGTGVVPYLLSVTALGFAAVAARGCGDGLLPLAGVYGVFFALSLAGPLWGRLFIGVAAAGLAVLLQLLPDSGGTWAAGGNDAELTAWICAIVFVTGGGWYAWGRLRRVVFGVMLRSAEGRLAKSLDLAILYGGTLIAAAVAFSAGDQAPLLLDILAYLIPAFSSVLIAAALVIPSPQADLEQGGGSCGTGCWDSPCLPGCLTLLSGTRPSPSQRSASP